jgi:riboflavin kinase / FMN adenylyltransferase
VRPLPAIRKKLTAFAAAAATLDRVTTIQHPQELCAGSRKVCLAIGVFDGVHLGHQQIIRQTIADARRHDGLAVVLTFDRHPSAIVAADRVPPLIYSMPQKFRTIASLGADALLLLRFDQTFSQQAGETFIRQLARDVGRIQSICVGADFVFGHQRSGNVALLEKLGAELNFTVHGIAAVALDGQTVSSTRVRDAIRAGDFDVASQMLGRPYSLAANIVAGDRLGQQLGFPTANLETQGFVLPPNGVYAAHATVAGQTHRAVANLGHRPTLQQPTPQLRVEVHLLDFSGQIYGQEMEVTFAARLRPEIKFPSVEALREQIGRDVAAARELMGPSLRAV